MSTEGRTRTLDRFAAFLLGVSVGALLSRLLSRSRPAPVASAPASDPAGEARLRDRWSGAWDEAVESLAEARDRLRGGEPPDLDALRSALAGTPGAEGVEVRVLHGGIVEVVGSAPDEDAVGRVMAALSRKQGVRVVVNRVWTPSSGRASSPGEAPLAGSGEREDGN